MLADDLCATVYAADLLSACLSRAALASSFGMCVYMLEVFFVLMFICACICCCCFLDIHVLVVSCVRACLLSSNKCDILSLELPAMKICVVVLLALAAYIGQIVAPPVGNARKEEGDQATELNLQELQDQEYFRYLTQVVGELEKDPEFKAKLHNATEDDIKTGRIADGVAFLSLGVRRKLDEVKRLEIEYQRDLLRQNKDHMMHIDRNYWNPIHQDNKMTFEVEDLKKLLSKHNDMMAEQDKKRREEFKTYEMQKEHEHREKMKQMSEEERKREEQRIKENETKHAQHEKLHEPGHKAQLEEVWEKEDGLDPDSFDPKTFFHLHDKNGDGYLDQYELETLFLGDLDKAYNETNPDTDPRERQEEMERMREHVMREMDKDKDGLLSLSEFMSETKTKDFEEDDEWKPLTDDDQFTEEELKEYERMLSESNEKANHHAP